MPTKLDIKTELIQKIYCLTDNEILKLKIFLSGFEAGKIVQQEAILGQLESMLPSNNTTKNI